MPVVIIPVLDEAEALPALLRAMPSGYEALVVDNGSSDGSADVAVRHGAQVVAEPVRGFGSACWTGLTSARPDDGVVCFMDGDGSFDPRELVRVADPVLAEQADLVLGTRRVVGAGSWPAHARVANLVLAWLLNRAPPLRRAGTTLRDLGPMRAARRTDLLGLGLVDRRSGWPLEMVLAASDAGWRLSEVDVSYHPRVGRSKVTGTLRGTLVTISDMSRLLLASRRSAS